MENNEKIIQLLTEIRDGQREENAWRRKATEESMRIQSRAVLIQRQAVFIQKIGLLIVALVLVGVGLLVLLAPQLFRS